MCLVPIAQPLRAWTAAGKSLDGAVSPPPPPPPPPPTTTNTHTHLANGTGWRCFFVCATARTCLWYAASTVHCRLCHTASSMVACATRATVCCPASCCHCVNHCHRAAIGSIIAASVLISAGIVQSIAYCLPCLGTVSLCRYQTSFGPATAYSNLWVNQWLSMYVLLSVTRFPRTVLPQH